jgi:hypothetical protein
MTRNRQLAWKHDSDIISNYRNIVNNHTFGFRCEFGNFPLSLSSGFVSLTKEWKFVITIEGDLEGDEYFITDLNNYLGVFPS